MPSPLAASVSSSVKWTGHPDGYGPAAVQGQRTTPSVAGKDNARLHTGEEAGPGFGDPDSDLTSLGGGGEDRGTGKGADGSRGGGVALDPEHVSSVPG